MIKTMLSMAAFALISYAGGCNKQVVSDCAPMSYAKDIQPILNTNCGGSNYSSYGGCHTGGDGAAGFKFDTYENTSKGADNPKFMLSIKHLAGADPMPHNAPKLDNATIQKIACWLQNGKQK